MHVSNLKNRLQLEAELDTVFFYWINTRNFT